jgi:hypothetical protein
MRIPTAEPPPGLRYGRAAGGFYWHLLPLDSHIAICGFEPSDSRILGRKMASRAGWNFSRSGRLDPPEQYIACPHCQSKSLRVPDPAPPL